MMRFAFAIITVLLMFQPDASLGCDQADWQSSFDHAGWSNCPRSNTYLRGLWRNDRAPGDERIGRIEFGKCCVATESAYTNQPSTCQNANWWGTLDGNNVWATCPNGYFLNGFHSTNGRGLGNIEEGKCCRPQNQPESWDHCYDEDVGLSFDNKGWSECKQAGYFMTGIYKGGCNELYCIEKFKCCRMKKPVINGGWSAFGDWSKCSKTCGDGQQARMRTCTNPPPSNGGAQCSGPSKETKPCNNGPCTVDGGWTKWSAYGSCSKTCGKGKRYKTRTCTNPPKSGDGKDCKGKSRKGKRCNMGSCKGQ